MLGGMALRLARLSCHMPDCVMNAATLILLVVILAAAALAVAAIIRSRRCTSLRNDSPSSTSQCAGCAIRPFCKSEKKTA